MEIDSQKSAESRCIVAVFAHPDDEIPVCGLLRRTRDSGDRIHLICATRGGRNRNPHIVTGDDIAEIRTKEYERVCDAIGAEYSFLDLPDGGAAKWDELGAEKLLTDELVRIDADIVIAAEKIGTSHPDHLKISDLASVAFTNLPKREGRSFYYLTGFAPNRVRTVLRFLPLPAKLKKLARSLCAPEKTIMYRISLSSSELKAKISLISFHASQFPDEKGRYYDQRMPVLKWIMRRERYRKVGETALDRTTVKSVKLLP